MDTPSPEKARQWLFALTEEPHVAGTAAEKKVADYVAERFKEFGFQTETVKYDVFLNHPKNVSLRMTIPRDEKLSLVEDVYAKDKDARTPARRASSPHFTDTAHPVKRLARSST